jgi:hypothetical protein
MPHPENSTTPNPLLEKKEGALPLFPGVAFGKLHLPAIQTKGLSHSFHATIIFSAAWHFLPMYDTVSGFSSTPSSITT